MQDLLLVDAINKAKSMEIEQIKDAYGDGLNAHRTNFCNRDEYLQKFIVRILSMKHNAELAFVPKNGSKRTLNAVNVLINGAQKQRKKYYYEMDKI